MCKVFFEPVVVRIRRDVLVRYATTRRTIVNKSRIVVVRAPLTRRVIVRARQGESAEWLSDQFDRDERRLRCLAEKGESGS